MYKNKINELEGFLSSLEEATNLLSLIYESFLRISFYIFLILIALFLCRLTIIFILLSFIVLIILFALFIFIICKARKVSNYLIKLLNLSDLYYKDTKEISSLYHSEFNNKVMDVYNKLPLYGSISSL